MQVENPAPVLITTLNRSVHFKRCVESLALCTLADKTELFIALDYPLHHKHKTGYEEIKKYLPSIQGFKSIIVIERDINFGAVHNLFRSVGEVLEKYDKVIISEDDNIFSSDFLLFVNKGLDLYEDRKDIFSVSGYQYPVLLPKDYQEEVYIWKGFSAWGFGIWREKCKGINWKDDAVLAEIKKFVGNYRQLKKLNKVANHYVPALLSMLQKNQVDGDGFISLYQFTHNMFSVFPKISRVRNTGHDGSGLNCGNNPSDIFAFQEIYEGIPIQSLPANLEENYEVTEAVKSFFNRSTYTQIKDFVKVFLFNAGLKR